MNVFVLNRTALVMIARHKLRTALTMLGVAIGVGAVVTIVAIGDGASAQVQTAIANLGVNLIWVEAGGVNVQGVRTGPYGTKSLVYADLEAIKAQVPLVTNLTPQVDTGVQLIYGNQNWRSSVRGITPEYLTLRQWPIVKGAMFTDEDVQQANALCVLGQTVVQELFGDANPIDETIRVKNVPCRVIGVLAPKGSGATGGDQDDNFLMPYTTVQKKIKGQYWLDDILCSARSQAQIDAAEQQIARLLRDRHRLGDKPDDFNLRHPVDIAETVLKSAQTMELFLAAVASVSLLVGGIGVMNIMLVSVTERTKEIGLRMSVGATGGDVLRQFLWEAILLTVAGGMVGVGLGIATSVQLAAVQQWPVSVSSNAILLAFFFSAGVGIFFGYYPAHKAARMEPIDALRFEA